MSELPASVQNEALRLLGIKGQPSAELVEIIERCWKKLSEIEDVKTIFRAFSMSPGGDGIVIDNSVTLCGRSLARLCANCRRVFLLGATLGASVDSLIRKAQLTDMADALILDACASAEADRVCDMAEAEMLKETAVGEYLTMRFSPGYGDVPVGESQKIISLLDTHRKIGLSATAAGMLIPVKSITALIGISDRMENRGRSCSCCGIKDNCQYRKRGVLCGIQNN